MKTCVMVTATAKRTRVVVSMEYAVVLRANLPPLATVRHPEAVTTLLQALSLWADERICVALCAENEESLFRYDLTDEMGRGARSVYYAVEVVKFEPRRRNRRGGDTGKQGQQAVAAPLGGAR